MRQFRAANRRGRLRRRLSFWRTLSPKPPEILRFGPPADGLERNAMRMQRGGLRSAVRGKRNKASGRRRCRWCRRASSWRLSLRFGVALSFRWRSDCAACPPTAGGPKRKISGGIGGGSPAPHLPAKPSLCGLRARFIRRMRRWTWDEFFKVAARQLSVGFAEAWTQASANKEPQRADSADAAATDGHRQDRR